MALLYNVLYAGLLDNVLCTVAAETSLWQRPPLSVS